ncbi:glycerol-1-phosphate dehydrogenase [NAD(P)+] [Georgenia soli]|uniref:Glycerol-1-phosphate dehydrogenase [NAD(P)+] n=1 Tax=Georgenia soli TaxID=638953 RepID=A0A2A9F399_9MICO|nr:iron-containing alcohol dehydrogenase [Georgenia soli]PFG44889.1 glycerol-1-phosphate dehydrogenase [NAD(P)+] [Georgenia soli]
MSASTLSGIGEIHKLLAKWDPEGVLVPLELSELRVGRGTIDTLVDAVQSALRVHSLEGASQTVALVADTTVITRSGSDLKVRVRRQLGEVYDVRDVILSDGHAVLHVTEDVLEQATQAIRGVQAVVAVGGGTISDIGKLAAARAGVPAVVIVQTAASVDGFTDNVSVVLRDGVKRTVPSRWPDVVIADAETIAEAPEAMNRAGYGEMTSMFTAPADWRLASMLGTDQSFHRGPIAIMEAIAGTIDEWSSGLRQADLRAVEGLALALDVRGIATGVAGTTACLSGVEHVVSHMLDLHQGAKGSPIGLHGAQVGVAAVVAATAWEMLFERMAAGRAHIQDAAFDVAAAEDRVREAFSHLDGRIAEECWADYSQKLSVLASNRDRIEDLISWWPAHERELRSLVRPAAQIADGLREAGSPVDFSDLVPNITPELARWAVESCALMRNRVNVIDLLTLLGWWTPADVDEVLQRAAQHAAGELAVVI